MNTTQTQNDMAKIRPGAWYAIEYGFERRLFCVLAVIGNQVFLERPNWLYQDSIWMTLDEMFSEPHNAFFVGYGKKRHIVGWLRRTFGCIGTCYTKPPL